MVPRLRAKHSIELPTSPPKSPNSLFQTQNSNFSAYLTAAGLLDYAGAGLASNTKDLDFLFHEAKGSDLLRRFNAGAVEAVNARVLFEVRGYLLAEIKRTQAVGAAHAETK
jgi:hypothetical protein